jgi:hypothetical protein
MKYNPPSLPLVGQWITESLGAISLGQGVVFYLPPSELDGTQLIANKKPP